MQCSPKRPFNPTQDATSWHECARGAVSVTIGLLTEHLISRECREGVTGTCTPGLEVLALPVSREMAPEFTTLGICPT